MKLVPKLDENGNLVMVKEGDVTKVVYLDEDDDNKEYPLDPASMYVKIINQGTENQTQREKRQEAEAKLKVFTDIEGIDMEKPEEWVTSATEAIKTVANYSKKDLVEAGKVEEVKKEMREAYEGKLASKDEAIDLMKTNHASEIGSKDKQIRTLLVSSRFSTSPYFTGGEDSVTTMLPDAAEAIFGPHFKVEVTESGEPMLKAYADKNGDKELMSKKNPGEPAQFDEAVGLIIDAYPNRDAILRAPAGGSGGGGGKGGGKGPVDEISKIEADLAQAEKDGNASQMIILKNKLFAVRKKQPAQ